MFKKLIIALLFVITRQLFSLLALIIPFSGAIILTIATLLLFGYSLSIFHLVTLLLVVGLAIDYSIFMFYAQKNITQHNNINDVSQVSVIICLISTVIMFGALGLSTLPVLKAIGLTASLGAIYAFLLTFLISNARQST
jgi:predicted exporter